MRRLFILSTMLFFLAMGGFWAASVWLPEAPAASGAPNPQAAPTPQAAPARQTHYTLSEVARHATRNDCWMAIRGQVYDFTRYVPQHPSDPSVFLPWCGKEASQAYRTKSKGRSHSSYADQLMIQYRIGVLQAAN